MSNKGYKATQKLHTAMTKLGAAKRPNIENAKTSVTNFVIALNALPDTSLETI